MLGTLAGVFAAMMVVAGAHAEEPPTRQAYAAQVEPICKRNIEVNRRILKGARAKVRKGRLPAAGTHFFRASKAFGKTIVRIAAVPRPPADEARLVRWIGFLKIVRNNLRKVGVALKKENRVRANHEGIRAERSGNAANNVASIFSFRHCKLSQSRFRGI